jgi:hypothetical protein
MERALYHVPVFGWMLKEAVLGPAATKTLFVVNLLLAWVVSAMAFGYPAIILPALTFVPLMFVFLIILTWPGNKA